MKWSVFVMVLISSSLGAMNFFEEESKDEIIEMGEIKKEPKNKRPKEHKRNGSYDIEFQDLEHRGNYYNNYTFNKEEYIKNFFLELPIFKGKKEEKITKRMDEIEQRLPEEYGAITEALSNSYSGFKKRLRNRGISDIDPKEVVIINDKIKYALLEIAHENQQIAAKNREEDLAQAASDRRCSIITSVVGFMFSVPAITLTIFNIIKLYHQ